MQVSKTERVKKPERVPELEAKLQSRFDLLGAVVIESILLPESIPGNRQSLVVGDQLHANLGRAAAQLIASVPVQREMESERPPLAAEFRPSGGDFQGMGVYRSDVLLGRAQKRAPLRSYHRLDEPTRLSLGVVASQQSQLPFHLAQSL